MASCGGISRRPIRWSGSYIAPGCCRAAGTRCDEPADGRLEPRVGRPGARRDRGAGRSCGRDERGAAPARAEEHTSELQSLMRISYDDLCLTQKTIPAIPQSQTHTDNINSL